MPLRELDRQVIDARARKDHDRPAGEASVEQALREAFDLTARLRGRLDLVENANRTVAQRR